MAKKKTRLTQADRERLDRMRENTERTRALAEKGLADLERKVGHKIERPASNAEWLQQLAEAAQAELDRKAQSA
jgi:hypothetical protein